MKITVLPLFVAALGLASQVSASPIRIYVLSHSEDGTAVIAGKPVLPQPIQGDVAHMRWGLAAAGAPQQVPKPMIEMVETSEDDEHADRFHHGHHHQFGGKGRPPLKGMGMPMKGCGRGSMRAKAIALQNWLRSKFGMEPIEFHHPHFRLHHHGRPHSRPEHSPMDSDTDSDSLKVLPFRVHTSEIDGEGRVHHHHHHFRRPHAFTGRLSKALMMLGPWEGRAIAFVIGCGIGSLLRMFYVLIVLALRGSRRDDEDVQEVTIVFDDVEEPLLPKYTDEKIPVDESPH